MSRGSEAVPSRFTGGRGSEVANPRSLDKQIIAVSFIFMMRARSCSGTQFYVYPITRIHGVLSVTYYAS